MLRPTLALFAALVTLGITGITAGCTRGEPATPAPPPTFAATAPAAAAKETAQPTVTLRPDGKPAAKVNVRVAATEEQRRRGLMYIQNLPPDDGMIFVFQKEDDLSFWMKNTMISLDMIFIGADKRVAGVVENARPLSTDPLSVGKPSKYVLEVNGGWARAHGVAAGTTVEFADVQ